MSDAVNTEGAAINATVVSATDYLPTLDDLLPASLQPLWQAMSSSPLLGALVVAVCFFVIALVVRSLLFRILRSTALITHARIGELIADDLRQPMFTTIFYFGLTLAVTVSGIEIGSRFLVNLMLSVIVASWMRATIRLTTHLLDLFSQANRYQLVDARTVPLFDLTGKLLIIMLGSYILLMIWGINPVGWLASAGIVGIAVGFAAKDTLGNLFSGFFIVADAPYKIGDYIFLDTGERGRVSAIGLRSTRLITRDDVEITIPNGVIAAAKIVNESGGSSSAMRIAISVGVAYGSDVDEVCRILTEIGVAHRETRTDPAPRVRMRAFGASSLDFQLLCWIDKPEDKGRITHELLMQIYKALAANNVEIPYSKHDVFIKEFPSRLPSNDK